MNATKAVERVRVMAGERQVVSQVGMHLLGDLADRAGLTSAYAAAVPWTGERALLRTVALDGELTRSEPKTLRYRLLHAAARILRRARQVVLRLPAHWPWAVELAEAYRRVRLLGT